MATPGQARRNWNVANARKANEPFTWDKIKTSFENQEGKERNMSEHETALRLVAGDPNNLSFRSVQFSGTLTPDLAIAAAKRGYGHAEEVLVIDDRDGTEYLSPEWSRRQS